MMHGLVLSALLALFLPAGQAPGAASAAAPDAALEEIHVDEHCRVLTQERLNRNDSKARAAYKLDPGVCRLQNQVHTSHLEDSVEQGVLTRTRVENYMATYSLTNPTTQPVYFILDASLGRGWTVDSTPKPESTTDSRLTFRIKARPGETVQLRIDAHN